MVATFKSAVTGRTQDLKSNSLICDSVTARKYFFAFLALFASCFTAVFGKGRGFSLKTSRFVSFSCPFSFLRYGRFLGSRSRCGEGRKNEQKSFCCREAAINFPRLANITGVR